ncbi:MAG: TIGR04325 family methyltransferase [Patescibacteria group bacterium]
MSKARKILKSITPPFIWNGARALVWPKTKQYSGDFKTWAEAKALTSGYDTPLILEKVQSAALKVKRGEAAYERDSVNFSTIEYSWPLLAGLLWIASQNENKLSVLDFGGSLGSSYYQNRKFLAHLKSLSWSIVEQKHFVEFGHKNLTDEHLKFYTDLKECAVAEKPDVFLLSSVLPYIEKPYEILELVRQLNLKYIIIDRTPFFTQPSILPDRITVQQSSKKIYDASYPAWFLNEHKLLRFLSTDYELIADWQALAGKIPLGNVIAEDKGYIYVRKNI